MRKIMYCFIIIAICLATACTNEAQSSNSNTNTEPPASGGFESTKIDTSDIKVKNLDISYADLSESQKLDIYLPNEGEGPFPVIIAFHGGAFKMGSKTAGDLQPMLEGLNHGYAVVCVDYRLSGEAIFPAAVNDVKAAIRYIRQNAGEYKLNAEKIAVWGDSAGGNLASIAGTTGGTNALYDKSLGLENVSDDVTVVIDWFGPINFLKMDEQFSASGITPVFGKTSVESSPESQYIGSLITEAPDLVKMADPTSYISSDDPAFLIEHGTMDKNVPKEQSIDFSEALKDVIGDDHMSLVLLEGAEHGGSQFTDEKNMDLVFAFLDKYMKQ